MNPPRNWLVTLLTASLVGISTGTLAAAPDNGAPTSATPDANATPAAATSAPPAAGTPSTNAPSNNPSANSATDASKDAQAKKIFDQLDTNHDGALSFEEFSRATFQSK